MHEPQRRVSCQFRVTKVRSDTHSREDVAEIPGSDHVALAVRVFTARRVGAPNFGGQSPELLSVVRQTRRCLGLLTHDGRTRRRQRADQAQRIQRHEARTRI